MIYANSRRAYIKSAEILPFHSFLDDFWLKHVENQRRNVSIFIGYWYTHKSHGWNLWRNLCACVSVSVCASFVTQYARARPQPLGAPRRQGFIVVLRWRCTNSSPAPGQDIRLTIKDKSSCENDGQLVIDIFIDERAYCSLKDEKNPPQIFGQNAENPQVAPRAASNANSDLPDSSPTAQITNTPRGIYHTDLKKKLFRRQFMDSGYDVTQRRAIGYVIGSFLSFFSCFYFQGANLVG